VSLQGRGGFSFDPSSHEIEQSAQNLRPCLDSTLPTPGGRMKVARFEDLAVWMKAKELSLDVYRATNQGPFQRDFGLRDQVRRASVSVMSNIAEGFERYSRSEFRHFLSIARGSASEVRSQVHLARELGYLTHEDSAALLDLCLEISRMLAALHTRTTTSL
jgi:four helix bundle protein